MTRLSSVLVLPTIQEFLMTRKDLESGSLIEFKQNILKLSPNLLSNISSLSEVLPSAIKNLALHFDLKLDLFRSTQNVIVNGEQHLITSNRFMYPLVHTSFKNGVKLVITAEFYSLTDPIIEFGSYALGQQNFTGMKMSAERMLALHNFNDEIKSLFSHILGANFEVDLTQLTKQSNLELFTLNAINSKVKFYGLELSNSNEDYKEWLCPFNDDLEFRITYSKYTRMTAIRLTPKSQINIQRALT